MIGYGKPIDVHTFRLSNYIFNAKRTIGKRGVTVQIADHTLPSFAVGGSHGRIIKIVYMWRIFNIVTYIFIIIEIITLIIIS